MNTSASIDRYLHPLLVVFPSDKSFNQLFIMKGSIALVGLLVVAVFATAQANIETSR